MAATVKAWGIPKLLDSFLNNVLKETEKSTSSLQKLPTKKMKLKMQADAKIISQIKNLDTINKYLKIGTFANPFL